MHWSVFCWKLKGRQCTDLQEFSFCVALFSPLFCPTSSSCLSLPGLSAPLNSRSLIDSTWILPPCAMAWKFFQGSKLGWFYGSSWLFPISQWSSSLVKIIVAYILTHFLFFSDQKGTSVSCYPVFVKNGTCNCYLKKKKILKCYLPRKRIPNVPWVLYLITWYLINQLRCINRDWYS